MIKNIIVILFIGLFTNAFIAQNTIQLKVISEETKETIFGANVFFKNTEIGNTTDFNGVTTLKI